MCQTLFAYTTAGVPTADHMAARDPVLHTLCNSIVATQNKEIDFLERWLAEHAGPAGTCGGDDAVARDDRPARFVELAQHLAGVVEASVELGLAPDLPVVQRDEQHDVTATTILPIALNR